MDWKANINGNDTKCQTYSSNLLEKYFVIPYLINIRCKNYKLNLKNWI